ncbi:MAG: hypothetical protein KAT16_06970 [Candidatus Heimdallarchaeota archaeon]|nr:hypothetical protein [Candidatus Heimdallarchaeota archaeon]
MPSSDPSSMERLQERLEFRLQVEKLIGEISTYLVFSSNFDKSVKYFLSELADLYHLFMLDSIIVCLFDEPENYQTKVISWNSERIIRQGKEFKHFPINILTWLKGELQEGREHMLHNDFEFPEEAFVEKQFIKEVGIETLIGLPIFTPEYLAGALLLVNFTSFANWEEEELRTLRVFADILGTAIYRKKTEETLSKSRDYLKEEVSRKTKDLLGEKRRIELILNTIKDGVIVLDADGKLSMANKTAREYFSKIFDKEIMEGFNFILSSGHPVFETVRRLSQSDEALTITIEPIPGMYLQFVSAQGKYLELPSLGSIIEFRDVTPFIEFENMRKQFVSTVSHELRTPITVISQSISNYEKYGDKLPEKTRTKLISAISRNANLLHELIEDLLLISRIDERRLKMNWQEYYPEQLLNEVLEQLEPRRKAKNIQITSNLSINTPLKGDPKRISQIYRIIVDNSLKYSNEGDSLFITIEDDYHGVYNSKEQLGVLLKFKDTGIGILEKDLEKLFERFFRSSKVSHIPGSGLGLGIAKDLVEMHEGEIFVESEVDIGTTIIIFSPRLSIANKTK